MYGINKETKETTFASPINAGIQEDITVTGIVYEPLKEGNEPLLQVQLADNNGGVLNEVLWPINEEDIRQRAEDQPREHKRSNKAYGFVEGEIITADEAVQIEANL